MYLNNYSVRVIGGQEKESGYVEIGHGKVYALQLKNDHPTQCDAQVVIDGKEIGIFRIAAHDSITLQRSPQDRGRFTFYEEGTSEAQQAQIASHNQNNGLIAVMFTPEREYPIRPVRPVPTYQRNFTLDYDVSNNQPVVLAYSASMGSAAASVGSSELPYRAGATGLSGHSSQDFIDVPSIEYDYAGRTTINLRLVGIEMKAIHPLIGQSNPIPPYRP